MLKKNATTAPRVTSSPWAKLTMPVTAKIREIPTAARATMTPSRRPSRLRSRKRLTRLGPPPLPVPRGKSTALVWPSVTSTPLSVLRLGSRRTTPLGSEDLSRVTL